MSDIKQPSEYYKQLTYNSINPFIGARLKLKRAKRHLFEVENTARQLPARSHYNFLIGPEPETGKATIVFITEKLMPMEFAAVVGDTVHNLRSAFDHIAVALTAPPLGTGKAANAYFPTGVDEQAFIIARDGMTTSKGKRIDGKMEGASADALRMVQELEPYNGGKHSLRPLHDLDILDKHKLIVPAISRMTVEKLDVVIGEELFSLGVTDFKANEDGTNFIAVIDRVIGGPDKLDLKGDFHPTFEIVFKREQPLGGEPIVESLTKIADVCEGFIETCEAHFLRNNP